jgi:hypothetical protein
VRSDPEKRAAYDRDLARRPQGPGFARHAQRLVPVDESAAQDLDARCVFCQEPCAVDALSRPEARCGTCASPLYPAERFVFASSGQRAATRIERRREARFFTDWPQASPHRAWLLDASPRGMRLGTDVAARVHQIVKIDAGTLQATGRVVHVSPATGADGSRQLGIELFTLCAETGAFVSCRA